MSGSTVEVTEDTFESVMAKPGIILVDWWAPWCGPCRSFAPTYEGMAAKHPDITFAKVNTEEQVSLAQKFDIRSIPTLMILRDQVMLYSEAGALPEAALEDLVKQVRALDMDAVRAKIAARRAEGSAGSGS